MSAVVSAQGNAPGVRPDPTMPSSQTPKALTSVSFEQRLNEQLPLELPFKDEAGRTVKLGEFFGRKPVILTFVYYECPMLCTEVLNGLESSLRVLNETIGKEFDVVTVSFDPKETPVLAAGKKKAYLERYKRPEAQQGWHFLTGDQASIDALTQAAGFNYYWDEASHQFAHASGIVVATPTGKVSRYFMGIEHSPRDVKFALIESSHEKIGTLVGPAVAVLLSLRSGEGQLRLRRDARGPHRRRADDHGAGWFCVRLDPSRSESDRTVANDYIRHTHLS